ncbi:hypothetical protein KCU88_g890, partial [Aureobasidium melanogenum]
MSQSRLTPPPRSDEAQARASLTPEQVRRIEINRLKAKALREQREAEAATESRLRTPDASVAGQKRRYDTFSGVPATIRDARTDGDPGRPLEAIRPARNFTKYVDYDFSKMADTKGGFLTADDDPHNKAMHADEQDSKPAHMTQKEWERQQLLKSLRNQKAGPFEPGISAVRDETTQSCRECGTLEVDWKWLDVFGLAVCNACKEKYPEKYSLLTKTEAREDYLLTDPDHLDAEIHADKHFGQGIRQEKEREKSKSYLSKCSSEITYHVLPTSHVPPDVNDPAPSSNSSHLFSGRQPSQQELQEAYLQLQQIKQQQQQQQQQHRNVAMVRESAPQQHPQFADPTPLSRSNTQVNIEELQRGAAERRVPQQFIQSVPVAEPQKNFFNEQPPIAEDQVESISHSFDAYGRETSLKERQNAQVVEESKQDISDGWDFDDGPPPSEKPAEAPPQYRPDTEFGGPDRALLAAGGADGTILIWAVSTPPQLSSPPAGSRSARGSRRANSISAGSNFPTSPQPNVASTTPFNYCLVHRIERADKPAPTSISPLGPRGESFVVGYTDASILIFDTRTGEEIVGMASQETYDGTRNTGVNAVVASSTGFDTRDSVAPGRRGSMGEDDVVHGATGSDDGVEGVVIAGYEDRYIRFFDANSGMYPEACSLSSH